MTRLFLVKIAMSRKRRTRRAAIERAQSLRAHRSARIEAGDENIRIIGETTSLEKAVGTILTGQIPIRGLARKWCATQSGANASPTDFPA